MSQTPSVSTDKLALLRGVSRSFYLSIRLLPAPLREPVAVAYLLARASDTIADTANLAPEARRHKLGTLAAAIAGQPGTDAGIAELAASFAPLQSDKAEQRLIQSLPQCLRWLQQLDVADRADAQTVLAKITDGQALDIERFGHGGPVRALGTADELDEYTYLVAGCVGEVWTDLCFRHLPGFTGQTQAQMREWGRNYGMALQLINILRDLGADLAAGRCYLPADELAGAGLAVQDLLQWPGPLQPVLRHWLGHADSLLAQGLLYSEAVHSRRVRAASALPALIGARTLALLRSAGAGSLKRRVKVPRRETQAILLRLAFSRASQPALAAHYARLRA